ncbi:hypothetical protein MICABA_00016 [Microbacterium sp. T2.11-28]|nr:hypothetical protein MICABA_00016 [Microbacterium sp. T2.11-28]
MPLTDGAIDLYLDHRRKGGPQHRVPVQIKGSTAQAKAKKSGTFKYGVHRDVIAFFQREGGGLYFVGSMPKARQPVTMYFVIIGPHKAQQLLAKMSSAQKTISVRMERLDSPKRLEDVVGFAVRERAQAYAPRIDLTTQDMGKVRVTPLNPLDLTKPVQLRQLEDHFYVEVEQAQGYWVPVDIDLTIYPGSYLPRNVAMQVSCSDVLYESAVVRQTGEESGELWLSPALTVKQRWSMAGGGDQTLVLDTQGSVVDAHKALSFFLAAVSGAPVLINGRFATHLPPDPTPKLKGEWARARELHRNLSLVMESLIALAIDPGNVVYEDVIGKGGDDLVQLHDALVGGREVNVAIEGVGRLDLTLNGSRIILIVAPGSDDEHKRFFNPFDPANRSLFAVVWVNEHGIEEISATAYDGLGAEDFASAMNLRLEGIVEAYKREGDTPVLGELGHRNVLKMLAAADTADERRRGLLLQAAQELNDWVWQINPSTVHDVNRLQIIRRRRAFTPDERRAAITLRQEVIATKPPNGRMILACLAILLEDPDELAVALERLEQHELADLQSRPIWNLRSNQSPTIEPR